MTDVSCICFINSRFALQSSVWLFLCKCTSSHLSGPNGPSKDHPKCFTVDLTGQEKQQQNKRTGVEGEMHVVKLLWES